MLFSSIVGDTNLLRILIALSHAFTSIHPRKALRKFNIDKSLMRYLSYQNLFR